MKTLMTGLAFGESPRWHDGRLWVSDWGAQEILAVDPAGGEPEVMVRVDFPSIPMCMDWLPDGRLLIVASADRRLLRREPDGTLVNHADLSHLPAKGWNEIVVDGRGNAYLNGAGFDMMAGEEPSPGYVALVTPDGEAREVAGGILFPNGMAVTPDNGTLIVADSYAGELKGFEIADDGGLSEGRVWADLGDGVPDGICVDEEGAVWYADVPNKRCVRVREGGEVLQTVGLERGGFACMLGGRTLYIVEREWQGPQSIMDGTREGRVLVVDAPAAGAGWP